MRANRALLLCGLVAVAISSCTLLIAGPTSAGAAGTVVRPESFVFEAQLPSSDGYSLYLRSIGHRKIWLDIGTEDFEEPYVTMSYTTTGRVDRHGVEADFGQFGRVDLRFSGSVKKSASPILHCRSKKPEVAQYGPMRGRVEFESLGGVVRLRASRVEEGKTWHAPKRTCTPKPSEFASGGPELPEKRGRKEPEAEPFLKTFMARGHLLGRTIDLYAIGIEREVADVVATSTRRFGPVLVSTSVHAPDDELAGPGQAAELAISGAGPRPRGARLSASAPFSGSATYRRPPGTPSSWLGSLAVEMPGEGMLPLAGPEFHAALCSYASHKLERACERTVAPPHLAG